MSRSQEIVERVLADVRKYGSPLLPLPTLPRYSEAYAREYERRRVRSMRRIDEMADRLCLPRRRLLSVLFRLEDDDVIDWRTGRLREEAEAEVLDALGRPLHEAFAKHAARVPPTLARR